MRFRALVGAKLAARELRNQQVEAPVKCRVLNRMVSRGLPRSERVLVLLGCSVPKEGARLPVRWRFVVKQCPLREQRRKKSIDRFFKLDLKEAIDTFPLEQESDRFSRVRQYPFLDGNGRLGRLLIALLLRHWDLLSRPLLYVSLFLKMHRQEYYRRIDAIRTDGDWEGWLGYFLEGVAVVADEAVATARHLHAIVGENRERLHARDDATVFSLRLFERLPRHPIVTVNRVVELLDCSRPAAAKAIRVLEGAGVLCALDERKKNRALVFRDYVEHLREGTELTA